MHVALILVKKDWVLFQHTNYANPSGSEVRIFQENEGLYLQSS